MSIGAFTNTPIHDLTETTDPLPEVAFSPPWMHDTIYQEKIKRHAREIHWEYVARLDQSGEH